MRFFDQLNEDQQKQAISHAFQELVFNVVVGDIEVPGVEVKESSELHEMCDYVATKYRDKLLPWAEAAAEGSQYDENGQVIYEIEN